MPNIANQPFADALAKTYPAPEGVKIFTAGADAQKMLAFWGVKQTTTSSVLRIGQTLFRVVLHQCPHCEQHLSAQAVKMSAKEREMLAALSQMLKVADASKPASKPAGKQAKQAVKRSVSDGDGGATGASHPDEPFEPNSADDMTLEQLEALTSPGA